MYSKISLSEDRGPTDAQDTEYLLSADQVQEKSLPSPVAVKRNDKLKKYIHIGAFIFYTCITIALYLWSAKLHAAKCDCSVGDVYSPARTALQYETKVIVHDLVEDGKYRGKPRQELDEAWEELLNYNNLRVQEEDLKKANLSSVPLNDEKGGYLVTLDVFHTLHCVNQVRKFYYSDYYHNPNPIEDQRDHFDHCIDLLRQTVMCHGDISLHTYTWKDDYRWPWPTMKTTHQCRNWNKLMEWSKDHSVDSLTGPILSHPILGTSFLGDEPHS